MTTLLTETLPSVLSAGDLALDPNSRELIGPGGRLKLARGPSAVLQELMTCPGRPVLKERLIGVLWSNAVDEPDDVEAALRKRVLSARDALEAVGVSRDRLEGLFQAGYIVPWKADTLAPGNGRAGSDA